MALLKVPRSFLSSVLAVFGVAIGFVTLLFSSTPSFIFSNNNESVVGIAHADAPSCSDGGGGDGYTSCGPCGDSCDAGCGCY